MFQKLQQSQLQRSWELCLFQIFIHLIFLNKFCYKVLAQTEISRSFFSPFNTDDNWNTYLAENSNHITDCVTSDIFGGRFVFNSQTVITKTFILPPHYKVKVELNFWRLDPWTSSYYIVFIDGEKAINNNPNSSGTEICGSGSLGQTDAVGRQIVHMGNSAIIIIVSRQSSAYWGISNFKLSVLKCPNLCHYCDSTGICQKWYRVLTYFTTLTLTNGEGWIRDNAYYDNVLDCGFQYYGNFLTTQLATIGLILDDPHTSIKVSFLFLSLEITDSVTIEVNGDTQMYYSTPTLNTVADFNYLCGSNLKMSRIETFGSSSSSSTITIAIGVPIVVTTSANTPSFGIRDFEVFTYQENKIIDEKVIHKNDYILAFEGIFSQQYNCVVGCSNCIRDMCVECFSDWNFDTYSQVCLPICGDKLILYQEECDDGNLQPNDGCYQCKFSCPLNCAQCEFGQCKFCNYNYQLIGNQCQFSCKYEDNLIKFDTQIEEGHYCQISNFLINQYLQHVIINNNLKLDVQDLKCQIQNYGIFAYQYNQCEQRQPQNCNISVFNECQICVNLFEKTFNGQCIPICSHGTYYGEEFLYNSIEFQFDNSYQCSLCQLECLDCHNSFCFSCLKGWNLVDYRCEYQCGDGIIAMNSNEQCDDQNQEIGDGCYECKFECEQNCVFCNAHHECVICNQYFEIKDKNCIPACGDGFVVEGLEICDDGNDIEYDGCHNCQYSCRENCQICDHQNCLDICDQGYYYLEKQCISICGDSIVAFNEECDDGNDDPFDGCDLCLHSCPLNCSICQKGLCQVCNIGFLMNDNNCQDTCGNGFKSDQEECDDGNHLSLDGCSNICDIEMYWTCFEDDLRKSSCLQTIPPHFKLVFLNQTYNVLYVQLQFTNKIKLLDSTQNLTQNFKAQLIDINPSHYIIKDVLINEPDNYSVHEVIYQLRIEILEQQTKDIVLQVQLNTVLVDQNDFQVDNDICKIRLKNPVVLTAAQKEISHNLSSYNLVILIFLGISSFIILISGHPAECFEILDTIQFQSYLKFINIIFPQNLMIYFESSEVVTINPILDKFGMLKLCYDVIGSQYLQAFGKFYSYDVNSDLISNLYGLVTQILLGTILLIVSYCYLRFIFRTSFARIRVFIYNNQSTLVSYNIAFLIHSLNQFSFGLNRILSQQGIVYILQANCWDLIFKTLLYIFSEKESDSRNIVQTVLASFILISIASLMSLFFQYSLSQFKLNKKRNFRHEGIIIAKKLLILLLLIGSQSNPILQCVGIAFVDTFYITLIIYSNMINNKIDLIVILIFEIPIIIFALLSLSFDSNFVKLVSAQAQIQIGFVQICLLIIGITAPLIKYASQIKTKITNIIQQWKQEKIKKLQQKNQQANLFY